MLLRLREVYPEGMCLSYFKVTFKNIMNRIIKKINNLMEERNAIRW
jgi:hypothetical protein